MCVCVCVCVGGGGGGGGGGAQGAISHVRMIQGQRTHTIARSRLQPGPEVKGGNETR